MRRILAALLLVSAVTIPPSGGVVRGEVRTPHASRRRALPERVDFTAGASNRSVKAFLHLPLSFEPAPETAASSAAPSSFVARGPGYTLSLSPAAAVLALAESPRRAEGHSGDGLSGDPARSWARAFARTSAFPNLQAGKAASTRNDTSPREGERSSPDVVRLELLGANASAKGEGLDRLPGTSNYFTGNDPKAWRTNVPTFARVRYESVYPGVDLVYYGNPQRLEYDLIVTPGTDVKAIRFAVNNGAGKEEGALRISSSGDLMIPTAQGEVRLHKPVVYQEAPGHGRQETGVRTSPLSASGDRRLVEGRYVLSNAREVTFRVGEYDHRLPLVIDPTLEYSSFLGASGWDYGVSAAVAVDSVGNLYIASGTTSASFPGTSGGYLGASAGCNLGGGQLCGDAFVTKINPSGTAILYSTYLGGSGADGAYGLAVDGAGYAYVTGPTDSTNFPTTMGAAQTQFGGDTPGCASAGTWPPCGDAFVTKLDPTGSTLIYSTYLGGSADDYAEAVAIDSSGNAYVTGQTYSIDYPTTPGAFEAMSPAIYCGTVLCGTLTVTKLNATGRRLAYSTYVGGGWGSWATAIAVNAAGEAYVTGAAFWWGSAGADFPTSPNAYQSNNNWGIDAILVKLDATGGSLPYATYLGGSAWEWGFGLALDASGNAYVVGNTFSPDFPTTLGAFQMSLTTNDSHGHGYVAKFDPSKSGASSLVFSSLLGGSGSDGAVAVAVSSVGTIYVGGGTTSPDFPTVAPLQGRLAESTGCSPCGDGFVAGMNAAGSHLFFSTFLGGTRDEYAEALSLDSAGNIYVAGGTPSADFPTTAAAFQTTFGGGGRDMFVAKISPGPNTPTGTNASVQPTGSVTLNFDNVTAAGTTAVTQSAVGPAAPAGFTLGTPAVYYDISTTAAFSGQASICVSYAGVTFSDPPALLHYQNSNWVNVTTSVDGANQIVCGNVTSFSPFAVFGAGYQASVQAPIAADGTSTFKALRGSVPLKFTLSVGGEPTCVLPTATMSLYRVSASSATAINEDVYNLPSDAGSQFRIDSKTCQYVYNVGARSLGPGTYRAQISTYGIVVGSATFALQ